MKIISRVSRLRSAPLIIVGIALALVGVAASAWSVRPWQPPPAASPLRTSRPGPAKVSSGHFAGTVQYDILAKLLADDRRASARDWQRELLVDWPRLRVDPQPHPLLEHAAPEFQLPNHREQLWSLHEQVARGPVVLVFYLSYGCVACVHDLFELNADVERFRSLGAEIVAVSGDSPEITRQRFDSYGALDFPVLCDAGHRVAQRYGVFRPGKESRPDELLHGTFLIGRDGLVHWADRGDKPFRNDKALLAELVKMGQSLSEFDRSVPSRDKPRTTP